MLPPKGGKYDPRTDTFYKRGVRKSKHLMRMIDGWGIDETKFINFTPETVVVIEEVEEGKRYTAKAFDFLAHDFRRDFGHGAQYFLPRSKFNISDI